MGVGLILYLKSLKFSGPLNLHRKKTRLRSTSRHGDRRSERHRKIKYLRPGSHGYGRAIVAGWLRAAKWRTSFSAGRSAAAGGFCEVSLVLDNTTVF
jgi:hypothetical protein